MTLLGALGMGRALAASRMTQTWQVGEVAEVTDPETYEVVSALVPVYDGPGRFKPLRQTVTDTPAAGQVLAVQSAELHLPSGTVGIETDMRAVCTACPEDASLVGRVLRIKGGAAVGQTTAARFPVEDVNEAIGEGS